MLSLLIYANNLSRLTITIALLFLYLCFFSPSKASDPPHQHLPTSLFPTGSFLFPSSFFPPVLCVNVLKHLLLLPPEAMKRWVFLVYRILEKPFVLASENVRLQIRTRRGLESETAAGNSSLLLAELRTHRKDPTNGFKYYSGGWNITDSRYLASLGFTAAPFFVIAAVWFLGFGVALASILVCSCCCRRTPDGSNPRTCYTRTLILSIAISLFVGFTAAPFFMMAAALFLTFGLILSCIFLCFCFRRRPNVYSQTCYALSLIFLVLFTFASIAGSGVLYTGPQVFHTSTTDTLYYVVSQADAITKNLSDFSDYLHSSKSNAVFLFGEKFPLSNDLQPLINSYVGNLKSLSMRTHVTSNKILETLKYVRIGLILVAAVMLLLALTGFLLSIFGVQWVVYTLVVAGWILVAGTFLLCGMFFVLHNVVADACVAMDEWVRHPEAHTALDDILPCVSRSTSQEILKISKKTTHEFVGLVNTIIVNISNANLPLNDAPLYLKDVPLIYNQSGPSVPLLCNPFNEDLSDRLCKSGEVDFNNATEVWKNYLCQISTNSQNKGICNTTGRLTPASYDQLSTFANMSYSIYYYVAFLADLVDCTSVRSTFANIYDSRCPGLQGYTMWIYIGLLMVSVPMMLSLILLVVYARERQIRVNAKRMEAQGGETPGVPQDAVNPCTKCWLISKKLIKLITVKSVALGTQLCNLYNKSIVFIVKICAYVSSHD